MKKAVILLAVLFSFSARAQTGGYYLPTVSYFSHVVTVVPDSAHWIRNGDEVVIYARATMSGYNVTDNKASYVMSMPVFADYPDPLYYNLTGSGIILMQEQKAPSGCYAYCQPAVNLVRIEWRPAVTSTGSTLNISFSYTLKPKQ